MSQTLDRFRSSTWGWLRGTFAGWGTLALFVAGPVGMVLAGGGVIAVPSAAPLVLSLAALVIVLVKWIANLSTTYEVTEDRLVLHRGIIMKSIDEIELYRIKDVRIDFSLLNQTADIGTIGITSSDETTRAGPLVLRDIHRARARRERLRDLVNAARKNRGVREIDMVHEDI
ncbi:PH domain-containing protein [Sphingomonas gilva]|uniref:PH domain-containing protein n=1 Tax=Sphingomonas gilva TaxID=2305907 RepID=A0A396RZR6_9SPHN|nr:PH domain-containing protein [Sphingomonas gilva]RHW16595.1 PH domain-containing protein [Sphingomonas gilva]